MYIYIVERGHLAVFASSTPLLLRTRSSIAELDLSPLEGENLGEARVSEPSLLPQC